MGVTGGVPSTRELIRELRTQGWRVEQTKHGHYKAKSSDGKQLITFCDSEEVRAMKNNLALLKRSGFEWPPGRPASSQEQQLNEFEREAFSVPPLPHHLSPGSNRTAAPPVPAVAGGRPEPSARELSDAQMESLFRNLKDARAELGAVEVKMQDAGLLVKQAEAALADAQRKADVVREEVETMRRLVVEAKAEFDAVFDVGGE